jgi:hypothetical protein
MPESKTCTLLQSQELIDSVFIYRTFLPTLGETHPLDEREDTVMMGFSAFPFTGREKQPQARLA